MFVNLRVATRLCLPPTPHCPSSLLLPGDAEDAAAQLRKQLEHQQAAAATAAAASSEAQSQLAAWQGKSAELATARASLQQLEERMFAGPAWRASPELNELGDSLRALEAQAAEVGRVGRWRVGAGGAWKTRSSGVCLQSWARGPLLESRCRCLGARPTLLTSAHRAMRPLPLQAGQHAQSFGRGTQLLQGAVRGLQEALQARGPGARTLKRGLRAAISLPSVSNQRFAQLLVACSAGDERAAVCLCRLCRRPCACMGVRSMHPHCAGSLHM